jgi:uncharacterized Zn finger protein
MALKEEQLEMTCDKCGRRSKIFYRVRTDGFNEWESVHCAYCGLIIDSIKSACTPKSVRIKDEPENNNEATTEEQTAAND